MIRFIMIGGILGAVQHDLLKEADFALLNRAGEVASIQQTQSFRPGRPVPTHRLAPIV